MTSIVRVQKQSYFWIGGNPDFQVSENPVQIGHFLTKLHRIFGFPIIFG